MKRFWKPILLLFCIVVILLFLLLQIYLNWGNENLFQEGQAGFWRDVFFRILTAAVIIIGGISLDLHRLRKKTNGWRRARDLFFCVLTALMGIGLAYWLIRSPIMDLPYLKEPALTYLKDLHFDIESSGDTASYQVEGINLDGERVSFDLNKSNYEKGRDFLRENENLYARISYLPHTEVVMEMNFTDHVGEDAFVNLEIRKELSDSWETLNIQIEGQVYSLPEPVSVFWETGWSFQNPEDANRILEGVDPEGGASENWSHFYLVNQEGKEITITIVNHSKQDIPAAQGTVASLWAGNENLDFLGRDIVLPGKIVMGWSHKQAVLEAYGEPTQQVEEADTSVFTYKLPGKEYFHQLDLTFDKYNILQRVRIQNEDL